MSCIECNKILEDGDDIEICFDCSKYIGSTDEDEDDDDDDEEEEDEEDEDDEDEDDEEDDDEEDDEVVYENGYVLDDFCVSKNAEIGYM